MGKVCGGAGEFSIRFRPRDRQTKPLPAKYLLTYNDNLPDLEKPFGVETSRAASQVLNCSH